MRIQQLSSEEALPVPSRGHSVNRIFQPESVDGMGKEQEIEEMVRHGHKKAICVVRARQERTGILYTDRRRIGAPEDVLTIFGRLFERAGVEQLMAAALTRDGEPVAVRVIAVGGVDSCMVSVAEVLKFILLSNCPTILLVHNHPSGNVTPSEEDITITTRIKEAAAIVGLCLLDHVIVGDQRHGYSLAGDREICLPKEKKDHMENTVKKKQKGA